MHPAEAPGSLLILAARCRGSGAAVGAEAAARGAGLRDAPLTCTCFVNLMCDSLQGLTLCTLRHWPATAPGSVAFWAPGCRGCGAAVGAKAAAFAERHARGAAFQTLRRHSQAAGAAARCRVERCHLVALATPAAQLLLHGCSRCTSGEASQ